MSVAAEIADTTWVFSSKRPYRRLRRETKLLAVTDGEKTTEPKASLEKTS